MRFPPPTLLVVLCRTQQQAEQAKVQLAGWLAPRGLAFNEDKTKIVHLSDGFDFLGHADLWIMPTWPGISLSQAAISPIVSA